MKELLKKAGTLLFDLVMVPVFILCGIILLLCIPVDFIRYRRSAFYKDTRQKYELFAGNSHWFQLYNAMRAENLPLDFYLHTTDDVTYGYFRYKNILLVQDYPVEYEPKSGDWFVYYEEEDKEVCTLLTEALETDLEAFNEIVRQPLCDRAVLLVDRTQSQEEDLTHLAECPLLLGYDGQKGMAAAIKKWIENNRG